MPAPWVEMEAQQASPTGEGKVSSSSRLTIVARL
jgi:hypothetical protein